MTELKAVQKVENQLVSGFTREQIDLIKREFAPGISDAELKLGLMKAQHTRLDPFKGHSYFIKRKVFRNDRYEDIWRLEANIEGYRARAFDTKEVREMDGPYWCGEDGVWKDVWTSREPPVAAKFGVKRDGMEKPRYAVADYNTYVQLKKDGKPSMWWAKGSGAHMLGKCAEALALRSTFPDELSGTYTKEEMGQAEVIDVEVASPPKTTSLTSPVPPVEEDVPHFSSHKPEEKKSTSAPSGEFPYWVSEWNGNDWLHVNEGEHFDRNFLETFGFKEGKKKGTWSQKWTKELEHELIERGHYIEGQGSLIPSEDEDKFTVLERLFKEIVALQKTAEDRLKMSRHLEGYIKLKTDGKARKMWTDPEFNEIQAYLESVKKKHEDGE